MKAHDSATLSFYASEAQTYVSRARKTERLRLEIFLSALSPGSSVLELGCGGGQDSEFMIARGFDVVPTDGTPEIAAAAQQRLGRPVQVLLFADIKDTEAFDGVWANACLLHVPRGELAGVLARIHAALKPGGVFYASFKAGGGDGRDRFDRYYNYPSADWLREAYGPRSWQTIEIEEAVGGGYDNKPTDWLHVIARKPA